MEDLGARMQAHVKEELQQLAVSQAFLQENLQAFEQSEKEVKAQTTKAHEDSNEVLEEIKMLREEVKQKVGAGLNELSAAAENISANIITELETFHTQVRNLWVPASIQRLITIVARLVCGFGERV